LSIPLHRAPQKLERRLAIPPFRSENFKHLAFMIDGAPQVMRPAIDANEYLAQMPAPP
jgi:hypothetical protein